MTEYRTEKAMKREEKPYIGQGGVSVLGIVIQAGKYLMVLAIIAYVVVLMAYTSGSTKPFAEVAAPLEQSIDTEELVRQDGQKLKQCYGLNSADYDGVLYYAAESNLSAAEVVLVHVKSEEQVQEVRSALEKRIKSREADFEGYAPEQTALLEQSELTVRGSYIFLAVSKDAQAYADIFAGSL